MLPYFALPSVRAQVSIIRAFLFLSSPLAFFMTSPAPPPDCPYSFFQCPRSFPLRNSPLLYALPSTCQPAPSFSVTLVPADFLVPHSSKLFSFSRKSYTLIVTIPRSSRCGRITSFTITIFLKSSFALISGIFSCKTFSLSGRLYADCR